MTLARRAHWRARRRPCGAAAPNPGAVPAIAAAARTTNAAGAQANSTAAASGRPAASATTLATSNSADGDASATAPTGSVAANTAGRTQWRRLRGQRCRTVITAACPRPAHA
jgi:streptogramin lyase